MLTVKHVWMFFALWVTFVVVGWVALVPGVMSLSLYAWINLAAGMLFAVIFSIARDSAPDPSMSQILYDVENPNPNRRAVR